MKLFQVTIYTDGNLVIHVNVQAGNPSAAWEIAVRKQESGIKFEIDSGHVVPREV